MFIVLRCLNHAPDCNLSRLVGGARRILDPQRIGADFDLALASHLEPIQRVETANHQYEVFGVQISEAKPLRPSLPKLLVERCHLWNGMNLLLLNLRHSLQS